MNRKFKIINVYAPTNKTTRTDQQQTEDIYIIKSDANKYARSTIITGDFNAVIAKGNEDHSKLIVKFVKNTENQ